MQPTSYPCCGFNEIARESDSSCILYDPPIEEFSVIKTVLERSNASVEFDAFRGPTIVICTHGKGTIKTGVVEEQIKAGWVYFVGAETKYVLRNAGCMAFETYQAFCDL